MTHVGEILRSGPLGGAQEQEWYLLKRGRGSGVPVVVRLQTHVAVSEAVDTVREVLGRHDALHSVFSMDEAGNPIQLVRKAVEFELEQRECVSPDEVRGFRRELRERNFTMDSLSFVRVGLAMSGAKVHAVVVIISHAFTDGQSCRLLANELVAAFGTPASTTSAPRERHQFLDTAISESVGGLAAERSAAAQFWEREIESMPPRLFAPGGGGGTGYYGSEYESTSAPALLAAAARHFSSTSAAVYMSLTCALAAMLADVDKVAVRTHFTGRTRDEMNTIGCYHVVLPVVVDLGDHPSLRSVISRVSAKFLKVQRRSRIGYLQLKEIMASRERQNGTEFVTGVTLNFDYRRSWHVMEEFAAEHVADLIERDHEEKLLMGAMNVPEDMEQFDVYLHTRLSRESVISYGTFNHGSLDTGQMRTFLRGPEDILRRALAEGDLSWSGIRSLIST